MVSGLVTHTRPTDSARLQRSAQAPKAATTIWKGIGSSAQNSPTMQALATVRRDNAHSAGSAIR